MQFFKLGALTALGALLAMPVMAQGSYQGMPQQPSGNHSRFNQAMNSQDGGPGMYSNQGVGQGGYAPSQNVPRAGNPASGNFGAGTYGQNMNMSMQGHRFHHRMVAHEIHDMRQALQRAGLTNVHIVPRSFLVRAQDQEGRQVLMIVSPHSVEEMMAFSPGQSGQGMSMRHHGMNHGNMAGNYGQTGPGWMGGNQR